MIENTLKRPRESANLRAPRHWKVFNLTYSCDFSQYLLLCVRRTARAITPEYKK